MVHGARIKRNSLFVFFSSILRLSSNFLLFVGIARFYGQDAFGQFITAYTWAILFLVLADFGFDTLLATEVSGRRSHALEIAQRFFFRKTLFALGASVAMVLTAYVQNVSAPTKILMYIFSSYVLFSSLLNFFFALFRGFEQLHHETRVSFVINITLLCAICALGVARASLHTIAMVFVATRIMGIVLAMRASFRVLDSRWLRLNLRDWKSDWELIIVFGVYLLAANLYLQMDTLLLSLWRGDADVATYQAVFKIVAMILILPDIAISALMPVLSRLHSENKDQWSTVGHLLCRTLFLIVLPIVMLLFVYAEQIIRVVYGAGVFEGAVPILRIFAGIVFVRFTVEAYGLMLTTGRRQKTRMVIIVFAAIVNFSLNQYVIPVYGLLGAAFVSLATNVFVGTGYVLMARPFVREWVFDVRKAVPLAMTIALSLLLWKLKTFSIVLMPLLALGVCAIVYYYFGFTKDERNLVFALGTPMWAKVKSTE